MPPGIMACAWYYKRGYDPAIGRYVLTYTFLSILAVSLAVINALRNYSNVYSIAIYLSKSSRSAGASLSCTGDRYYLCDLGINLPKSSPPAKPYGAERISRSVLVILK